MKKKKISSQKKKKEVKWPQPRKILYRPGRLSYILSNKNVAECVFCENYSKGLNQETLVLAESELSMIFINKFPYNNGHLLVLPKRHVGDFLELTDDELIDIQKTVRRALGLLKKTYKCENFNVGLNLGKAAGAGIPKHLHYHIIPRWMGDSNFFPIIAGTKVISETVEQVYARLAGEVSKNV